MTELVAFGVVGLGTYLFRVSGLIRRQAATEPSPTLRLIAPVVLAAIVADQLLVSDRSIDLRPEWLIAAAISAVVSWRTRSAALTMAVGLAAVWIIDAVV